MNNYLRKLMRVLGHREWIRFGIRDRIIRFTHDPDSCTSERFEVPFFGGIYSGDFATFVDWSVYYYGAYAREELRLMEDFLPNAPGTVLIDVGANVGHHTLFAAMRADRVLAFEPWPKVAAELRHKIAANRFANVTLVECGLGTENSMANYAVPLGHNTGTGSFVQSGLGNETLYLPIRVGDEALAEQKIERVDFIKIDTEGFESEVLGGLRETMARHRPFVLFEWSQKERGRSSAAAPHLLPDRYQVFSFEPDTVVFWVFRKSGYCLRPVDSTWPDGYLFAIPTEAVERIRQVRPSLAAQFLLRSCS